MRLVQDRLDRAVHGIGQGVVWTVLESGWSEELKLSVTIILYVILGRL